MSSPGLTGRPSISETLEISLRSPRRTGSPPSQGMTFECWAMPRADSPAEPFRLARQLDSLDLIELDRALGHQVVNVAIGRAGDLRAIDVDLHRAAMVLLRPGRGVADAL